MVSGIRIEIKNKESAMARVDPLPLDQLTAEQRALYDSIATTGRSAARGPFSVLLRSPEVAEKFSDLVTFFHSETGMKMALKELAILTIARLHTAQYEWHAHEKRALDAGVPEAAVEALRRGETPAFDDPEQALVHALTTEIIETRNLSDETYARAIAAWGEDPVIELMSQIATYVAIALFLVVFQVGIPDGKPDPLPA